jgi:hypothetical protein
MSLYVSEDGTKLLDVNIPSIALGCVPGRGTNDHINFASIDIASDGSFDATSTQDGLLGGRGNATFTYRFSGHLHGLNSKGQFRISGSFREDIQSKGGTSFACTSNELMWRAER